MMCDEQHLRFRQTLQPLQSKVPLIILQRVEERFPALRERQAFVLIPKCETDASAERPLISYDDENRALDMKVEEVVDIKEEDVPEARIERLIKTEHVNYVDVLRGEHFSCTETCPTSSGNGNQFLFVNVEQFADTDGRENPEPSTSTTIKTEPANCVDVLRGDPASGSEMCLRSSYDGNVLDVKGEEAADIEEEFDPEIVTFRTTKIEPELCMRSGVRRFICDVCNKAFGKHNMLITHKRVHTGERPFFCVLCNRAFSRQSNLMAHKRIHSGERPFSCDVCNTAFGRRCDLMTHKRIHSGERPFSCDECNKAFGRQSTLMRHKQIHTGERPFSCDVCNKAFAQRSYLMTHMRIHTGERPFSCDVCNRAFHRQSALMTHKRIHTGERPFSCDVCKKAFGEQGNLMRHKRMHSGERPFSCDLCNKAFGHRSVLMTHKRIHSGKQPLTPDVVM